MIMTEGGTIVVDGNLPEIAAARALDRLRVAVTWTTGRSDEVDLSPDIMSFKVYAPLRSDRTLFESLRVVDDGNAIAWGDGQVDMPATAVERLAEEVMTETSLRSFMQDHDLTRDALAAQLGVSRRLVGYWLEGQSIPRYIGLACQYLGTGPARP